MSIDNPSEELERNKDQGNSHCCYPFESRPFDVLRRYCQLPRISVDVSALDGGKLTTLKYANTSKVDLRSVLADSPQDFARLIFELEAQFVRVC